MRKLSLALNDVVSRHARSAPLEHVEVCLAACGLLTAYLERVNSPGKRRALAACFSQMVLAAADETTVTQVGRRRLQRPIGFYIRRS